MKPEIHLSPNAIPGGQLGIMVRNESGHPLQYYYGRMAECVKWARLRWPGHKIIPCEAKAQVITPPVA